MLELLGDPNKWEEARSLIASPPLSNEDFVKILDRYSDSNWEKHILGDLYRNEGLASLKVIGCRISLRGKQPWGCRGPLFVLNGLLTCLPGLQELSTT